MKKHLQFLLFCKGLAGRQKTVRRVREAGRQDTRDRVAGCESPSLILAGLRKTPFRCTQNTLRAYTKSHNRLRKIRHIKKVSIISGVGW